MFNMLLSESKVCAQESMRLLACDGTKKKRKGYTRWREERQIDVVQFCTALG